MTAHNSSVVLTAFLLAAATASIAAEGPAVASEQAKKQLKAKTAPKAAPQVKRQSSKQTQALETATTQESRKFNTLSNASKQRHDQSTNAIRNQR